MRRRWRRKHLAQAPEINITAFMNLMVILVPFLLLTAVFSRITILELDVPKASNNSIPLKDEQPLILEVTVREKVSRWQIKRWDGLETILVPQQTTVI